MPPKVIYSRESILRAALDIVREGGAASLNARSIASRLGCSTQPLYRDIRNMEEIRRSVLSEAQRIYEGYLSNSAGLSHTSYKSAGMAFLRFADEEKELFKLLFMRDRSEEGQAPEAADPSLSFVLEAFRKADGLTLQQAKEFHLHMSIYAHGLGVMIATNYTQFDEKAFSDALTIEFNALKLFFSRERAGDEPPRG